MKSEPNYSAEELAKIHVPVTIAHAEHDEFIKPEHAECLARTLAGVSHFAPLQRPEAFNGTMIRFLGEGGLRAPI